MTNIDNLKNKIKECLQKLYKEDRMLFEKNKGKGLCERCLVFRFGLYLQKAFKEYFVDCDFNSASKNDGEEQIELQGKPILNSDGTSTKRFVDIIIHRRTFDYNTDYICFEVKKWNNYDKKAFKKDQNNLRVLTGQYGYKYGFHLVLGKSIEKTKWTIYEGGAILVKEELVFSTDECQNVSSHIFSGVGVNESL